jgi:sugar phosphate isomerase/epimerase
VPHTIGCSLSLTNIHTATADPARRFREGVSLARACGCEGVHLDGAARGMRGRDLDRSGRREIAAILKREGLFMTGIDLWIPEAHFADPARIDRAIEALGEACVLAGELARLTETPDPLALGVSVCVTLPKDPSPELVDAVVKPALSSGVRVADYNQTELRFAGVIGAGFDPALAMMKDQDAVDAVSRNLPGLIDARLNDFNRLGRCPVGRGDLDVTAYRALLESLTSLRWVVVDVRTIIDPVLAAREAVEAWRTVVR